MAVRRKRGKGSPFKKGRRKVGGRKKGVPNRVTAEAKATIEGAAAAVGGVDGLAAWYREKALHRTIFWSDIFVRLLPLQVQSSVASSMVVKLTAEELAKRLHDRGLPPIVFDGGPAPSLD